MPPMPPPATLWPRRSSRLLLRWPLSQRMGDHGASRLPSGNTGLSGLCQPFDRAPAHTARVRRRTDRASCGGSARSPATGRRSQGAGPRLRWPGAADERAARRPGPRRRRWRRSDRRRARCSRSPRCRARAPRPRPPARGRQKRGCDAPPWSQRCRDREIPCPSTWSTRCLRSSRRSPFNIECSFSPATQRVEWTIRVSNQARSGKCESHPRPSDRKELHARLAVEPDPDQQGAPLTRLPTRLSADPAKLRTTHLERCLGHSPGHLFARRRCP
jgi:hypothetical protein